MQIAISITTHNRYETFKKHYDNIKKFLPKGAKLVVIDDGSDIPVKEADFRFEKAQGIAAAKNKSLELMGDADYYFCFDDDVSPKVKNWHIPYIESGLNHLCFTFDHFSSGNLNGRRKIKTEKGISIWHEPCGLMLFFTRKCLDTVGGMDESYGAWGYEHLNLSRRIYNNGLTPHPYMDIENSLDIFNSDDYNQTVTRSVDPSVRNRLAIVNQRKYRQEMASKAYIPFKKATGIILTSYFTGVIDPQRGQKWEANIYDVKALSASCKENNCKITVINDCLDTNNLQYQGIRSYKRDMVKDNPYFERWFAYRDYLKSNPEDNVWLTDCNDVEVLKNPFQIIQPGKIYCGWEKDVIGCQWMQNHHKSNFSQNFIKSNIKTPLLNAGVIGGRYDIVMEFLDRLCDMYQILPEKEADKTDMTLFNWVLYSHFLGRVETGLKITTEFKSFKANNISLFKHK